MADCGPVVPKSLSPAAERPARTQTRWLWLPAEDGTLAIAEPPATFAADLPAREMSGLAALRVVRAG